MLRLITIAFVVMFNSPEQLNSKYLLVEVANDSQVKNVETPGNGKGRSRGKFQGGLRPLNSESLVFHLLSGGIITFHDFSFQNVNVMKIVMMVQTLSVSKDSA